MIQFLEMECSSKDHPIVNEDSPKVALDQARPSGQGVKQILNKNIRQLHLNKLESVGLETFDPPLDDESQCMVSFQCLQQLAKNAVESKIFQIIFMANMVMFLITCMLWDPLQNAAMSSIVEPIELGCHIIFLIILAFKILEWKNQKVLWIILDFLLIITGIVGYALEDNGEAQRYMKAFRTLRLIYFIKQLNFLNQPTTHLITALAKMGNMLITPLVIIYVYALVGLFSFSDYQFNRCRSSANKGLSSDWTVYSAQVFLCGERSCPTYQSQQLQCLNPINYGVSPNQNQLINMVQGNSLLTYSNIFYAILSTFKQTFVTGSSRLILLYKDVLNPIFVYIYYYTYIYLISYIYLNIFYSLIIVAEWDNEDENESEEEKQKKIKNDFRLQESVSKKSIQRKIQSKKQFRVEPDERNMKKCDLEGSQVLDQSQNLGLKKTKLRNIFQQAQQSPELSGLDLVKAKTRKQNFQLEEAQKDEDNVQEELAQKHPTFFCAYNTFTNIIIILTCINLSLEFHGQSSSFQYVVSCIDFGFYCLFTVEVMAKIIIYKKTVNYLNNGTKLDLMILFVCTGGVIYQAIICSSLSDFLSASTPIEKVLRSFKYLRIFVLILETPFFQETRLILTSTFRVVFAIKNLFILWFLIVLIIAIMGFHLHNNKTKIDSAGNLDLTNGSGYQVSMDTIFSSMIFTMLTFYNEQWDFLMFQQYLGSGALVVVWQLISLIVGLVLFSKYFMALLMNELESIIVEEQVQENDIRSNLVPDDQNQNLQEEIQVKMSQNNIIKSNQVKPKAMESKKNVSFSIKEEGKKTMKISTKKSIEEEEKVTLCIRHCTIAIRRFLQHIAFIIVKVIVILMSCLYLINSHPQIDRSSAAILPYIIIDRVCFGFFMLEFILSLSVYGLFSESTSYLRRSWLNWLNIVILVIEILAFTSLTDYSAFLKIQRFKVLRILFFVELRYRRDWSMRMTTHAFFQLLPKVFKLLAVTITFYMFFALILVKTYKDDFYYCENYYSISTILTKNDCLSWGGDWIQRNINTANLFNSTLFLFLVATTEGWITLMTTMMDLKGKDLEPSYNYNQYINIFFVFFFFFGNLIMLNVFVGLSVSNFKRLKEKTTGESKLTKKERMWLSVKEQIYRLKPLILLKQPTNTLRGYAFTIAMSKQFKIISGLFFMGFMIAMSFFKSNMSDQEKLILKYVQYAFVGILFLEECIELLAFGLKPNAQKESIFKKVVLIFSLIYVIVDHKVSINESSSRMLGALFITLQFCRYLLLLNEIPFARKLLNSIATILPRTTNIFLILGVTLFIYTIFGMELFSFLRFSTQLNQYNQNYTNVELALFALVKFSTMESPIQQIIDAAKTSQPNFVCQEISSYSQFIQYGQNGCGSQAWSYIFFISFHIFFSLLLMSTLMAVIVDSYSEVKREENAFITKFVLQKVRSQWSKIDPEAIGFIPYRQFWMFTAKLLHIYMGQKMESEKKDLTKLFSSKEDLLNKMAIPIYQNENGVLCFQFHEVIQALTRIYIQNSLNEEVKSKKTQEMFRERQSGAGIGYKKSYYTSSHVSTLIILKSGLRWWKNVANKDTGPLEYKLVMKKFQADIKKQ